MTRVMLAIALGGIAAPRFAAGEELIARSVRAVPVQLPESFEELPAKPEEVHAALTLDELEGLALANNPTLFQAASRIDAARGNWLQEGLKPNPDISYQGQEIGNEGAEGMHGLMVSQEFVTKGKLYLSQMAAQQQVLRAEQLYAVQRQRVLTDVRQRFYEALVAQKMVDVARTLLQVGEKGVTTAENLLNAREVARIDLLQARVIANTARIRVAQAETQQQEAWRRLEAVVGTRCLTPMGLHGEQRSAAHVQVPGARTAC